MMKTLSVAFAIGVAVAAGVLGGLGWSSHRQAEELRSERARLEARVAGLTGRVSDAEEARRVAEAGKDAQARLAAALQRQVAELTEQMRETPPPRPVQEPSRRVRAFIGRDALGEAWLISSRVGLEPETGKERFEPVVVLDERLRGRFTVTNQVEREVIRTATVHNTYVPPARNYYYPIWYPVQQTRPERPSRPGTLPTPTPPRPGLPNPPRRGSPW